MSVGRLFGLRIVVAAWIMGAGALGTASAAPGVKLAGSILFSELVPNDRLDSGEGIGVVLCLQGTDAAPTPELLGVVAPTSDITETSDAQVFGELSQFDVVCRRFSFVVATACGRVAPIRLQVSTKGGPFTTIQLPPLPVGDGVFSQYFDTDLAPTLPAQWTASASGAAVAWRTQTTGPVDTSPNRVFANEPATVSDNTLTSPAITLPAGTLELSFSHVFDTESGWDGGALEIAISGVNGGAFADIITAGGTFIAGGYTGSIPGGSSNPLKGRQVWTGDSAGVLRTRLTLPPSASGKQVQLRWRMGTDGSNAKNGWSIDTVAIVAPTCSTVPTNVPWAFASTVSGNRVDFEWRPPLVGPAPTGYVLEAGLDNVTFPFSFPTGPRPSLSVTGPDIAAVARVRAVSNGTLTNPSNKADVNLGSFLEPELPRNLLASVEGTTLNLAWSVLKGGLSQAGGGTVSSVQLEAGTTPGAADIGAVQLPADTRRFSVPNVPPGHYFLRVRQRGPSFTTAASNDVEVNVPGTCAPPAMPRGLTATVVGNLITLNWDLAPLLTPAPSSWTLEVGSFQGLTDLATVSVQTPTITAEAPPNSYWVRVYASNACGNSPKTADVVANVVP